MADVFISYAHAPADEQASTWLAVLLNAAGITAWQDAASLRSQSGAELNTEIAGAIRGSRVVVSLVSAQYLASPYCRAEAILALENSVRVLRLNLDAIDALPDALLPLAAADAISLHTIDRGQWASLVAEGLALCGVRGHFADIDPMAFGPHAAIIRPSYSRLRTSAPERVEEWARRLVSASSLNAANGYTQLSLALLWLFQSDVGRSVEAAEKAVSLLPREGDAHYALALCLCAAAPPSTRSRAETEAILRRLATARRLPRPGAHLDLLSALAIANHYVANALPVPEHPETVLAWGLGADRIVDAEEIDRVLSVEPYRNSSVRSAMAPAVENWRRQFAR